MILKCIDKSGYHLTIGKNYLAEICNDSPSDFFTGTQVFDYYIINDLGVRHGIEKEPFVEISKLREGKLKELGI